RSQNGVLKYTSTQAPTYPLLVDTSLESTSATVQNAVISIGGAAPQNVVWVSTVNATPSGSTLMKIAGCDGCGDAGAISQQTIASGDGYVQFSMLAGAQIGRASCRDSVEIGGAGVAWRTNV